MSLNSRLNYENSSNLNCYSMELNLYLSKSLVDVVVNEEEMKDNSCLD